MSLDFVIATQQFRVVTRLFFVRPNRCVRLAYPKEHTWTLGLPIANPKWVVSRVHIHEAANVSQRPTVIFPTYHRKNGFETPARCCL